MTKTTKGYAISHNDKTITLTKAYAKKANTPGTREFKELANLHKNFPDYDIVMRTATITADKNTHDGLSIEMIEKIISRHSNADELKREYDELVAFWGREVKDKKTGLVDKDNKTLIPIKHNNLLDINAAVDLISEFGDETTFAILKHNNACGLASRPTLIEAWKDALAGDPVSAFGGVLITNKAIDKETAEEINKIFFEVIIAPDYDVDAIEVLTQKKNRIILVQKALVQPTKTFRNVLNGVLVQERDAKIETPEDLTQVTKVAPTASEVEDMLFANKIVKQSKSNAIVLAKNKQLIASGVGQTSRVDALKHAIEKAGSFGFSLEGAVMASDAFFPFPDCVEIAHNAGVTAVIHPGGSIKDNLSVEFCDANEMAMVTTGFRHFKH